MPLLMVFKVIMVALPKNREKCIKNFLLWSSVKEQKEGNCTELEIKILTAEKGDVFQPI